MINDTHITLITLGTMAAVVLLSVFGLNKISFKKLERYNHALAGATILFSGMAILFLGW